jgi:ADP-ribose pyrophosphatase YjhB (NUDIX family)
MRVCAGGVLVRGGELLLARRSGDRAFYPGVWDVVGGHCEPGESPRAALVREVEEEIGVVPRAFREVAVLGEPDPAAHGKAAYHVFAISAWDGGEPRRVGAEHSELCWLTLERAVALPLAHPEYPRVLRQALAVAAGADRDDGAGSAPPDGRLAAHPEVRALVDQLLAGARSVLGARLIGLYVGGSLAIGDFAPDRSDVDFVAVTDGEIGDDDGPRLAALHARLAAGPSRWGDELEGSYVSLAALVAPGLRAIRHPYIDRGTGSLGVIATEAGYWEIQRWLLREHGIAVAGPSLRDAIGPVGPDRLRAAVVDILREWWLPMVADPRRLSGSRFGYRCYAVLTMCRMLYTLAHGTVVTKPAAARWAAATLGPRWTPLIERALAWSPAAAPDLGETLALIRHAGDAGEAWRRACGRGGGIP